MTRVRYNIGSYFGPSEEASYQAPVEIHGALSKVNSCESISSPRKYPRIDMVRLMTKGIRQFLHKLEGNLLISSTPTQPQGLS